MDHELNESDGKQPYEAPQLTTISLRPEEAVLGHCKISGTGGPVGSCAPLGTCPNSGS
jgi:hypothetical protein